MASSSPATSENLMPSEDFTYTLALDLPKLMALGPPARCISFLDIHWPRIMKMTMGSTQLTKKAMMGLACWRISPENWAPESSRRWVRSGSGIMPVLKMAVSSLLVKTIWFSVSCTSTRPRSLSSAIWRKVP